ncbi:MAG: VOC family protein [Candidatus Bathyarchaeia archaeon]
MEHTYHTVVHFEIPAENVEKMRKFYSDLFGWKIERVESPTEYYLIETAPEGRGVGGGLAKKESPSQRPMNYILVESVEEYSRKVQELGGKIITPKQTVPGMGHFAIALDPEGNIFGLWEAVTT